MMKYYTNDLQDFIVEILQKNGMYGSLKQSDRDNIYSMIIDMLYSEARKTTNKSGYVVVGVDKEELEKIIIKSPTLLSNKDKQ